MAEFVMNGEEDGDVWDSEEPIDITGMIFRRFGEWMPTNVQPAYLAYSMAMVDDHFDSTPQPVMEGARIAICGFGSSLKSHLESIRLGNYDMIFTCSGAHDVLIDAGIIPTCHVELDWKPHKSEFTKNSHPGVKYLIASTCHPQTIDNCRKHGNIALIHIAHGPEITLPDESLVIPMGYDVGQTAIQIAKLIGFRDMSLFGFDYSYDERGFRHAGAHGGRVHYSFPVKVGNKIFMTSKTMLSGLLVLEHTLRNDPDLNVEIHGDALLINFLEWRARNPIA